MKEYGIKFESFHAKKNKLNKKLFNFSQQFFDTMILHKNPKTDCGKCMLNLRVKTPSQKPGNGNGKSNGNVITWFRSLAKSGICDWAIKI